MKTKKTIIASLFFSFLFTGTAFGKTEELSDLGKLKRSSYKKIFMQNVVDADSISRVFDAQPVNDFEKFKMKLAPDAGTAVTRRYKAAPSSIKSRSKSKPKNGERPRLRDFSIFGSDKKEL